jgi:hypothetical protein
MHDTRKSPTAASTKRRPSAQPQLPVIGLEAEFTLYVNQQQRKPEDVFGNPRTSCARR